MPPLPHTSSFDACHLCLPSSLVAWHHCPPPSLVALLTLPLPALTASSAGLTLTSSPPAFLFPSAACHLCNNNTDICSCCIVHHPPPTRQHCRCLLSCPPPAILPSPCAATSAPALVKQTCSHRIAQPPPQCNDNNDTCSEHIVASRHLHNISISLHKRAGWLLSPFNMILACVAQHQITTQIALAKHGQARRWWETILPEQSPNVVR